MGRYWLSFGFICLAVLAISNPAWAQSVSMELNKLEQTGEKCLPYFVFKNGTPEKFTEFRLDLFLVGQDEIIIKRIAVEAAPLRPQKTTVKLFELEGIQCTAIKRILVNDVLACQQGETKRDDCVDLITLSSRGKTELVK